MYAWLPDIAKELAQMTEVEGGLMLSLFAFAGTPMALAMPILAARLKNIGWLTAFGGLLIIDRVPVHLAIEQMLSQTQSFPLIAIPFHPDGGLSRIDSAAAGRGVSASSAAARRTRRRIRRPPRVRSGHRP